MMDTMMILGPYLFGLATAAPQEISRDTTYRWPAQDVFGGPQALQFTGWGEDKISLAGVIYTEFIGGTGQLDAMRATADMGEPLTLIDGRGNVIGDYVILSISERQDAFAQAGAPLRQQFTMSLHRYGGEAVLASTGAGSGALQLLQGSAVASMGGLAEEASALAGMSAAAMGAASAVLQGVTVARDAVSSIQRGIATARDMQGAAQRAAAAVKALGNVRDLTGAEAALNGLISATTGTVQTATSVGRNLGTISQGLNGAPAAAMAAISAAKFEANKLAVAATRVGKGTQDALRGIMGGMG